MVFSSVIFIFAFLPVTLTLYFLAEKSGRISLKNAVVLIASIVFYSWGGLGNLFLLLILILLNWLAGILMCRTRFKKQFLLLGILIDLGSLGYFKYMNFLLENLERLIHSLGAEAFTFSAAKISLPIGISFFTFQIMSYLIDVYRGDVPVQKNIARLAMYIMMFPQLIAGPIVRYRDVNEAIENRLTTTEMAEAGVKRFIIGFAKKVFIANYMGSMADSVFGLWPRVNTVYSWLGAVCYALQIFFDFAAYSDMAIGLGLIFGFRFNENFNYPYMAKSVQEFWRRWHISLSTWFRDYVYIPLGGNRKGKLRTYVNLFLVFLLTGFWHGAAWQFIVWGLFHGLFLIIERAGFGKVLKRLPAFVARLYTLMVVLVGWVFFRAASLYWAIYYLRDMFCLYLDDFKYTTVVTKFTPLFFILFATAILACTPIAKRIGQTRIMRVQAVNRICYLLLWFVSVVYLTGLSYNPFIYFRF